MKSYMQQIIQKIDVWNLFIGVVIGFGAGVYLINALVPNAAELIRMYRLDQKSVTEDRAARKAEKDKSQETLQIDIR
jgi:hypothetical protein